MQRRKGGRSNRNKSTTKDEELLYRRTPIYNIMPEADVQKILDATFKLMKEIGVDLETGELRESTREDIATIAGITEVLKLPIVWLMAIIMSAFVNKY